jgi:hypothetical protein
MVGDAIIFRVMAYIKGEGEAKAVINDPTLYLIETTTQSYTGRIAFQNDVFMKVELMTEKPKVVKILKENIVKVQIISNRG